MAAAAAPTVPAAPPSPAVPLPLPAIATFCQRWGVAELALFGSVWRDDFRPADSDVDVMVTFEPGRPWRPFFDLPDMRDELQALFGRPVDLLTRPAVEAMTNWYRRRAILDSARVVYVR